MMNQYNKLHVPWNTVHADGAMGMQMFAKNRLSRASSSSRKDALLLAGLVAVCCVLQGATLAQGTAPAAGAAGAPAAATAAPTKTVLGYIASGGLISYVLVMLSVVALALIIINFMQLRRDVQAPPVVVEKLERLLEARDIDGALNVCRDPENACFLTRVIDGGLRKVSRSQFGTLELKPALEEAGSRELDRLDRVNAGIGMLAAVGPMLGLLGTVVGMIGAFSTIGMASGASKNEELARYMSIALVTTAEGLIIAIPCTFAYAWFKRRIDSLAAEVGEIAEHLVTPLIGKGPASNAPVASPKSVNRPQPAA
jgi:biopolymer transport protein ExbB